MAKIHASLLAFAAVLSLSTSAVAMGDCEDGHTATTSQQLVDATGGQTPMTPKPTTGSGG
jgi:hypothetical protein